MNIHEYQAKALLHAYGAPVAEGQRIGALRVTLEGRPLGEYPVVALEQVAAAGILGRAWDTLRLWIR